MLRLTEADERASADFRKVYERCMELEVEAPESNKTVMTQSSSFDICARVFRSPSLFEDMVKCILLCNCQYDFDSLSTLILSLSITSLSAFVCMPTISLTCCRVHHCSELAFTFF